MTSEQSEVVAQGAELVSGEPVVLSVLPLKNVVALPRSIIPVIVGRELSIKSVEFALRSTREIFVTAQKNGDLETPTAQDIFHIGTRATILQVARLPNGTLKILIEGIARAKISEIRHTEEFITVVSTDLTPKPLESSAENKALWRNLYGLFSEYISLNEKMSQELLSIFQDLDDLDYLTDTIAVQMQLNFDERQKILELVDLKQRAIKVIAMLRDEIDILKAELNIRKRVQTQIEKHQKDYYLNEQIRAIQRELGREDLQQEIDELRKKAKKLKLPEEAMEKVEAECRRLEQMQPTSPESAVSRNYVDLLLSLPWKKISKDTVSLAAAEKILEQSHAGMKKPKERILEFIAAKKFAGEKLEKAPIICLVGPPGVGKTSLAHSIADALGRPLVRISLGGLRDEAEIRGHRRTYIGAMPGKLVQGMRKAKVVNPVILLDEIDKMSSDFRGDPSSALLEVLDPEQNKAFSDHYLEIGYDLSKVMFIATANLMDNVPAPLLDRMEMVVLSGYTDAEKLDIARKFLVPKLIREHGLTTNQVTIPDKLLEEIIEGYTKEAGVRNLERTLAKLLRKAIQELLADKKLKQIALDQTHLEKWLGPIKYKRGTKKTEGPIGVATGLAWTEAGGDVLEIEVTILKGKGGLTLTGQLGEVMQESAQAGLSYIRSKTHELGLKENFYADSDIHVHVPEGAIPKDGPSAGITIATALISALTKIPIAHDVAMTGEVTLRGRVLPVGGLKEKLLAATRFGFSRVIVPKENQSDIKEFESELDPSLKILYADSMDFVLEHALTQKPQPLAKKAKRTSKSKEPSRKKSKKS